MIMITAVINIVNIITIITSMSTSMMSMSTSTMSTASTIMVASVPVAITITTMRKLVRLRNTASEHTSMWLDVQWTSHALTSS